MIEVKVASKETVKLSFGGSHGFPLEEFVVDAQKLEFLETLATKNVALHKKLEEAKCGPHCFPTITKLQDDLKETKEQLRQARGAMVSSGSTLYVIDTSLSEGLKALVRNTKPGPITHDPGPTWQPIWTAPKDGRAYLFVDEIVDRAHRAQIGFWRGDGLWLSDSGQVMSPTHWMPLPEPPR